MVRPMGNALLRIVALAVLAALGSTGCAGPIIYDQAALKPAPARTAKNLVVTESDNAYLPDLQQALAYELSQSGLGNMVFDGSALGAQGAPKPAYLITFRVKSYRTDWDETPPGAIAVIATGCVFIVPFAFIGMVRQNTTHELQFDVEIRDVSQVPLVVERRPEGATLRYDVSNVLPLFRRSYYVQMKSGMRWTAEELGNADDQAQEHRIIQQLAIRMLNTSLPDIATALRSFAAQPPPAPPAPSPAPGTAPSPAPAQ